MKWSNPWLSIWTKPRSTILQIVSEDPKRGLWALATIYGFLSILNMFQTLVLGYAISLLAILVVAVVFAPLWGMALFAIWSRILFWTGKILGGKGSYINIRAAYAWSNVPLILSIILWLGLLTVFGSSLFQNFPGNYPVQENQILFIFLAFIAKVVIAIWSLVIFINTLAEVQQFSVARSILNIVFSWIVLIGVISLIWWGVYSLHLVHTGRLGSFISTWVGS